MRIKNYLLRHALLMLLLMTGLAIAFNAATSARAAVVADDQSEVRGVVRQVFEQLKARQYSALYDRMPESSQRRISRERFTSALRRTSDMYELERLEIGAVRVSGDIAVVDMTMYAHVSRPVDSDGKVVSPVYLVREGGRWRVVLGDSARNTRTMLADYPDFIRRYPPRDPRVYVKRDGRWVDVSSLARRAARKR
ncbi:MAG TPA: hypothetical protein VM911_11450 [Pyrinomonadaceae bacterium]|jgi:hypothetical protein|nr:hypothetical protein [Pyrinomonadaceae bacterium]